jgi:D-aminoacyl-tRNA deacylase
MRAIVQLVKNSSVKIDNSIYSSIGKGFNVLLGISERDTENDIDYIIDKIINLRIFKDLDGKMNESISSCNGEILVISQFTLYGDARKGRRPSFIEAAKGEHAIKIFDIFVERLRTAYDREKVKTGIFGAMMEVEIINDGPVSILLDSEKIF